MNPKLYEVFLIRANFGLSADPRPCVILQEPQGERIKVGLVSSALDFVSYQDFLIEDSVIDFPATGLKRTSFVSGAAFDEHKISDLIKELGQLEGELRERFMQWLG